MWLFSEKEAWRRGRRAAKPWPLPFPGLSNDSCPQEEWLGFAISGANAESALISLSTSHFLSESSKSCRGEVISKWLPFVVVVVFSRYVISNSFGTLQTIGLQAPLSMGSPRQEYWSGLLFPFPGDLPGPGIEPMSPALACRFFTAEPPGKAYHLCSTCHMLRMAWMLTCVVDPLIAV